MAVVRTDAGTLVSATPPGDVDPYTDEQAAADAAERNERAEALGIQTRYVVADK